MLYGDHAQSGFGRQLALGGELALIGQNTARNIFAEHCIKLKVGGLPALRVNIVLGHGRTSLSTNVIQILPILEGLSNSQYISFGTPADGSYSFFDLI